MGSEQALKVSMYSAVVGLPELAGGQSKSVLLTPRLAESSLMSRNMFALKLADLCLLD